MDERELIEALAGWVSSGRLDRNLVLAALKELGGKGGPGLSPADVIAELESRPGGALKGLAGHLRLRRRDEASRCRRRRKAGPGSLDEFRDLLGDLPLSIPLGWTTCAAGLARAVEARALQDDLLALEGCRDRVPALAESLEKKLGGALAEALAVIDPLDLIEKLEGREPGLAGLLQPVKAAIQEGVDGGIRKAWEAVSRDPAGFPYDLDDEAAAFQLERMFSQARSPGHRRAVLDVACSWPTSAMAPLIRRLAEDAELKERAVLLLTLRFDEPSPCDWQGWSSWLSRVEEEDHASWGAYCSLAGERPAALLLLWTRGQPWVPEGVRKALEAACRREGAEREFLASRTSGGPADASQPAVVHRAPSPAEPPVSAGAPAAPRPADAAAGGEARPPAKDAPPAPSLWDEHVLPFLAANWTMLAGIAMVVVGSSLLAYYTWDRHWLVRYTVLPALLAGFTWFLARLGGWIERRDAAFRGTADLLRGAAIALLPANFMAMALLANDPQAPHKEWLLPGAALLYLVFFGKNLRAWCSAVEPCLKSLLGDTILLLNALVLLGPMVRVFDPSGAWLGLWLGAGFHVGFVLICWSVHRFVTDALPAVLGEGERVPWFFGVLLATTFVQVFLWVHGFMRHLPLARTYACMTAAAGGLILFAEQGTRRKPGASPAYGRESFLGYAFVLLGLFMGASQPATRTASLALAGAIWLHQAGARRDLLHAWIALTLLVLSGASIATWYCFPGAWMPGLGLGLALAAAALGRASRRWWDGLEAVSTEMQAAVLAVVAVVAVLAQRHYASPPLRTAAFLVAAAGLFGWRARQDGKAAYVHSAMAVLAVALPYLGFADLSGRLAAGNNLAFGLALLSFLWLGLLWVRPSPLLLEARSTVLLIYGAPALCAMLVRVGFEQGRPMDALPHLDAMSLSGPLLMASALLFAAYFSRSLLPTIMAVLIGAVLFPQLKLEISRCLPFIHWGSGLMSGLAAAGLALACFPLRSAPWLACLPGGDRFMGRTPYPLERRDHALFTGPLMAAALFLAAKVDVWNLGGNILRFELGLKAAAGLVAAGAAWTLAAVFLRSSARAGTLVHLGWLSGTAGIAFGYFRLAGDPAWHGAALACGSALSALYLLCALALAPGLPWVDELLSCRVRRVLRALTCLFAAAALWALAMGADAGAMAPFLAFVAAELCWFGLTDGQSLYGVLLFLLAGTALVAWRVPGPGPLLDRLTLAGAAAPVLSLLLAVQAYGFLAEAAPSLEARLKPLAGPAFFLGSLAALAFGAAALGDALDARSLSGLQRGLLLAVVLAAGRAQSSGPFAALALALGYLEFWAGGLAGLGDWRARVEFLAVPWRLSSFALAAAAAGAAGSALAARAPRLARGPYSQGFLRMDALPWVHGIAMLCSAWAVFHHAVEPGLRSSAAQLWAPYLAAAAFALAGLSWRSGFLFAASCLLLTLGNIHAVRVFLGGTLRPAGLMENHLFCLGAMASIAQLAAARAAARADEVRFFLHRVLLALAGFILALLAGTYSVRPDLERMTELRFVVSGLLALGAGLCFHRAARNPDPGERAYVPVWEGLYHLGVVTALWCGALLIPWFRRPNAAFLALGLPVLYFYLRAESGKWTAPGLAGRYRGTAAGLSFFLLVLYVFRPFFQMALFPEAPLGVEHYHFNAPFVALLGLVMLRLHGLGGTFWLSYYGGLALMAGSFFALTGIPGLSPFTQPMASAWCAAGLGHFWLLFSSRPSPLRSFVARIARLDGPAWEPLRGSWGLFLLGATQAGLLWGIMDYPSNPFMVAPLLLAGASLLAHQGWIRRSPAFFALAGLEALAALHAGFLVPSWLAREAVVWALVAAWGGALAWFQADPGDQVAQAVRPVCACLGAGVLLHVLYHRPDSPAGLWAFAAAAALAAVTPLRGQRPPSDADDRVAALLLVVPTWLVLFSQRRADDLWPCLAFAAAILGTGLLGAWVQGSRPAGAPAPETPGSTPPRLFGLTMRLLGTSGFRINSAALCLASALTAWTQAVHYGRPFGQRSLALILGLYAASAAAWRHEGRLRKSMAPYVMLELCVLGFLAVIRRQVMLSLGSWSYEYDVWAALLVSFSLAGARQVFPPPAAEARIPLLGTLLAMPAAALAWVLVHGLGTDTVLVVVGLYSLMFAYMGKDDRESPYHVVAVGGFVSFVLIVFWTKLELRVVQAYVIPAGLGVLALVQMFRDKLSAALRNEIRAVALLAMLGSSAYYALLDDSCTAAFHMTLLLLAVAAMALGSLLRIRLYILLGFAGFLTDLASLVYKVLVHLDRGARMTLIGIQVLVLGALMIGGAIVYRTHQERVNASLDLWRKRLSSWE